MSKKAYSYIRFSTPEQLKGDSLRRQLESSREYSIFESGEISIRAYYKESLEIITSIPRVPVDSSD